MALPVDALQLGPNCKRLDYLPDDIFLSCIFPHLGIEDIICLRRVNSRFNTLTRAPVIWKSFLKRLYMPLTYLRPSYRFSSAEHAFEAEQMITRAVTLDDNWRRQRPRVHSREVVSTEHKVMEMKLVPGGKYLVTSVKCGYQYFISIICLEHPGLSRPSPVVRVGTGTKAYDIQAKYMKVNGVQGIVIMFLQRRWTEVTQDNANIDPSMYSSKGTIDPPYPMTYECVAYMVSLDSLEAVLSSGPHTTKRSQILKQDPFTEIVRFTSETPLERPILYSSHKIDKGVEEKHAAFGAVVKREPFPDEEIIFFDFSSKAITGFIPEQLPEPEYFMLPHRIEAFRVLPEQGDVLIIRAIGTMTETPGVDNIFLYTIELYGIPDTWGEPKNRKAFYDRVFLEDKLISSFHLDDPVVEFGDDHPVLRAKLPPPISIYGRTIKDVGLIHINISPEPCEGEQDKPVSEMKWHYTLNYAVVQSRHITNENAYVLPGVFRSLIYVVPADDRTDTPRMLSMRRYINPDWKPDNYEFRQRNHNRERLLVKLRKKVPKLLYASLELPPELQGQLAKEGLAAITFDDGIGRICVSSAMDREKITVVDLSYAT